MNYRSNWLIHHSINSISTGLSGPVVMSSPSTVILLRSVTVVGVVCLFGIQHAIGASLVTRLHNRARMKRQSIDDTTSKDGGCTLDYGIHLQLTEIEADIQSVFVNYVSTWGVKFDTCTGYIASLVWETFQISIEFIPQVASVIRWILG